MQARYQATLQPELRKGQKAACPGWKQVVFLRDLFADKISLRTNSILAKLSAAVILSEL